MELDILYGQTITSTAVVVSDKYIHYYNLKDNTQLCQLDTVFKALRQAAHHYTKRYGKVPVLFIDGADLLTKFDKEFTSHLISHAKVLANSDLLRVCCLD